MLRNTVSELSSTGEFASNRRGQFCWALVEFARSPYLGLVFIFVFPPYFANTVIGDPVKGQELWGLSNTLVSMLVGVLAPFLGAMSDRQGRRKTWLAAIFAFMIPCCMALWFAMPGAESGLPVSAILCLCAGLLGAFLISEVFHNSMLPSIAQPERIGFLSGLGLSLNNLGSLLSLLILLIFIALPASNMLGWSFVPDQPWFGLDPAKEEHNRIAGPIAGIWLLIFVLPFMWWTPDRPSKGITASTAVREGMAQVWHTVKQAKRVSNVGIYLLARMFYNDGKVAIIAYSGIYAAGTFHWTLIELLLFAIVLAPFSIIGGFMGGQMDARLGSKRSIQIAIAVTALATLAAVTCRSDQALFMSYPTLAPAADAFPYFQSTPERIYLALYAVLAAFIAAAFSTSRSMMARIAPIPMMSQFFGLYALSGSATAFLGHGLVTFFTSVFESQSIGLGSAALLLLIGLILVHWVEEKRSELPA